MVVRRYLLIVLGGLEEVVAEEIELLLLPIDAAAKAEVLSPQLWIDTSNTPMADSAIGAQKNRLRFGQPVVQGEVSPPPSES
jgi:hypothetical protein